MFQILCDAYVEPRAADVIGVVAELWAFFAIAALLIILIFLLVKGINGEIDKKKSKKDSSNEGGKQ